jgi:hypothetical protein
MATTSLDTYLNDHLAGSTMALELLAHLEADDAQASVSAILSALRAEITADRQELEVLMERLGIPARHPRRAVAWLAEKVGRIKLRWDDERGGRLRLLQGVETIAIGIEGKRALWTALAVVADHDPTLNRVDFDRLLARAMEQRAQVEEIRLNAARDALGSENSGTAASR